MQRKDWLKLAKALKCAFSQENYLPDEYSWELFYNMLKDLPTEAVTLAVNKCILECRFPPKVAELREAAINIMTPQTADWSTGWGEVIKCIGMFGRDREKEALGYMSEITAECVKRLGWKELCLSEYQISDREKFKNTYETIQKRKKQDALLPLSYKERIASIQQQAMPQLSRTDVVMLNDNDNGFLTDT